MVEAVSDYFQNLRELHKTRRYRFATTVVGAGKQFAAAFNLAWESLEEHRNAIDHTVDLEMNRVNQLSGRVANLNQQIKNALDAGVYPNDLMDERLIARDELGNYRCHRIQLWGWDFEHGLPQRANAREWFRGRHL